MAETLLQWSRSYGTWMQQYPVDKQLALAHTVRLVITATNWNSRENTGCGWGGFLLHLFMHLSLSCLIETKTKTVLLCTRLQTNKQTGGPHYSPSLVYCYSAHSQWKQRKQLLDNKHLCINKACAIYLKFTIPKCTTITDVILPMSVYCFLFFFYYRRKKIKVVIVFFGCA